jgi:type 1 glutamine amidotransferase
LSGSFGAEPAPRKIVLIAGEKDKGHPAGTHEYELSVRLLEHCLKTSPNVKGIRVESHFNGWPRDERTLDDADTIVLISSGGDRREQDHPLLVGDRLLVLEKQMKRGCGLVTIHWTTFFPNEKAGDKVLEWVGGYFDYQSGPAPRRWFSDIKTATATVKPGSPEHPICRGLKPFELREEFYYNIRFKEKDARLKPILIAPIPGVAKEQTVAWAVERKDGGRGFSFTGGHFFDNWYVQDFRKMVLNAIVWTARAEVPKEGVASTPPPKDKPIQALILTGHDGPFHKWRETSQAIKDALEQDERIKVRIIEDPEFLASGDLQGYDVIVQNYVNWERPGLSDKAKTGLVNYLKAGKGLVVVHFANGAFHSSLPGAEKGDWPEYRKIVRRVWDHKDKKTGHDGYGPFRVHITNVKHPITEGIQDFDTVDELYYHQAGDALIEPLITAKSKNTGKDEPLAWAYDYEKGRVFQSLLGHAAESHRSKGAALLLRRGVVWAANREQKPIPVEKPAPPPPGGLSLVEGRFGKALDARATPVTIDGNPRYRNPPLTVECWAKLNSKTGFNVLVANDTKDSGEHWEIYSYINSGAFSAYLPGMHPSEIVSKSDICDAQWHYLAMTFDGKDARLFVDGKQAAEQTVRPKKGAMPKPGPLTIGMALAGVRDRVGCDGFIDDVRISSTIRKIDGMPNAPLPLDIPTIGLWRFDLTDATDVDPAWTPRPGELDSPPWEKATDKDWIDPRFQQMDTGPFLDATFSYPVRGGKEKVFKGTAIKVGDKGEAAVLYDRNQMRFAAAWTGKYLNHSSTRFGLLNTPTPAGEMVVSSRSSPGWADTEGKWESKHPATAPLPANWVKYRGLYVHDKRVVLWYTVGTTGVLESPWVESGNGCTVLTRTLEVGPSKTTMRLLVAHMKAPFLFEGGITAVVNTQQYEFESAAINSNSNAKLVTSANGRVELELPAHDKPVLLKVFLWKHGKVAEMDRYLTFARKSPAPVSLAKWIMPGDTLWEPLQTKGEIGKDNGPFAVDTLTVPYDNPYKALFFVTGVDVMPNGDLAVCTAHGDVWLVKGIDEKLDKLTWKRYATGLYQPLGLKVVDGKIIVLERGQLTKLHDYNNDDEADFYENLCNDWHTGGGEHSYDTCLEVGPDGSFYFFKTGDTDLPTGGCLMRVSKDVKKAEVFATGFRHPIGLGMSPTGVLSGADQEGNWMPATRIDLYKKGGFYGDMRAHHRAVAPKIYDEPLCWLPRQFDNSAGGQVWVPKGKWGPLSEMMLHLSFGKCRMMLVLPQQVGDAVQGGAVDLGLQFLAGVKTGCFHPRDGHLYVVGLQGWQTAAVKDGCLQRVRYTGKKVMLPIGLSAHENGIKLTFSEPLDRTHAEEIKHYSVEQWNYHWSGDYGSQRWSVAHPDRVGQDRVPVKEVKLLEDGKNVFLTIDGIKPVMQMQVNYNLKTTNGEPLAGTIYHTIHKPAPR